LGQSGEGNGNSGAEEEAAKKAARKAELKALFQAAFTVEAAKKMKSTLTPPPEPNKDKPLDSAAIVAIKSHLHKFEVDLNGHDKDSGKLKVAAHKAKVTEMHHLLLTKLEPLFKNNSKANLEQFKEAVEKLLADEKSSFKATPWIWHDVIRPALVGLIGVIVSIVTLPVRPFKSSVADYANSFFVKPDSKAQIALKEEADMLMNEVEKAAAPGA
ncbi:MAG: hypothetical protein K0U37_09225, partial [Gammaproteobacteria bacterium]|nr:hypothetical protein [Gammaproteobacteria bacterium]